MEAYVMHRAILIKYAECLLTLLWRPLWRTVKAAVSHCEVHTYLAAVRTLSKNNVEALPAGRERSQPLKGKKKTTSSNHYLGSDVSVSSDNNACFNAWVLLHTLKVYSSIIRALCGHFPPDIFLYLWSVWSVCSVSTNAEDMNDVIPVQADGAHFLCVVKLHQSNSTIPPSAKWRGLLGPVTVLLFGYPQPGLNCYIQTFHDQDNINITAVTVFELRHWIFYICNSDVSDMRTKRAINLFHISCGYEERLQLWEVELLQLVD